MTITVDDFLSHHGVKGMHWGQRKAESTSSTNSKAKSSSNRSGSSNGLSDEERAARKKKILIAAGITLGIGALAVTAILVRPKIINGIQVKQAADLLVKNFNTDPKTESTFKDGKNWVDGFLTKDVVLPSGTKFNRVASTIETEIGKHPKYANYRLKDVAEYQSNFNSLANNSQRYKTLIESTGQTRIAGLDTMMKTAYNNASSNSKASGHMRSEIIAAYKGQSDFNLMREKFAKASDAEVAKRWLDIQLGDSWSSPVSQKFTDSLKKSGYAGLTDQNDSYGGSRHAVVLINDAVVKLTGRPMSVLDVKAAQKVLNKL